MVIFTSHLFVPRPETTVVTVCDAWWEPQQVWTLGIRLSLILSPETESQLLGHPFRSLVIAVYAITVHHKKLLPVTVGRHLFKNI